MAGEDVAGEAVGDALVDHTQEIDHPHDIEGGDGRAPDGARRPGSGLSPIGIALALGVAVSLVLAGVCGWLGYRAYQARAADHSRQLFIEVGKQGAINLTTIDYAHAEVDVKRILDLATGQFYDEFSSRSGPFVDVVQKAQSKSSGTVTEAGLESMTADEGQVLVAVTVTTTTGGAADQQPRYWRMRLTVRKADDGAKIAKVDFVP
jgi:Mce-associated membrane protein